jgi:hypothetical protein
MFTRGLEKRNEQFRVTAATQLSEIGRKTQMINRLKAELANKSSTADASADRKALEPGRTAPISDLETTLAERGLLLDQCDAQIDALFDEIAVIEKDPAAITEIPGLKFRWDRSASIDGDKSRKATRLRA